MNFVFTVGDINGIGPEIIVKTLNRLKKNKDKFIVVAPSHIFAETLSLLNFKLDYKIFTQSNLVLSSDYISLIDLPKSKLNIGKATKHSGKTSYDSIITSYNLIKNNFADAIITAPISKTAWHLAGYKFPGHTELFGSLCNSKNFVMMFLSNRMNGSLLTIHEPIQKVSRLISAKKFETHLAVVIKTLKNDLLIEVPKIAVLGLNPHAGEDGKIGYEEIDTLSPIIKKYKGIVHGPFPSDAFFANKKEKEFDLVIGMYHDQLLIPFKMMNFSSGVNFTAGLPIVRTSPDHGTAYDIAWKGIADESSMFAAYKYAKLIATNRKKIGAKK